MRAFCDVQDMDIVEEIQDDGYSGTNTRRPGYQRLFDPEFRGEWDVLVVMKMDRIHRNSRNFMDMMDLLKKGHQQFVSTYDRIDTSTAIGRFTMDMIQRIAQLESEQTGERTYMGMREKAEEGAGSWDSTHRSDTPSTARVPSNWWRMRPTRYVTSTGCTSMTV